MRDFSALICALLVGAVHGGQQAVAQVTKLEVLNVHESTFPGYAFLKHIEFQADSVKQLRVRLVVAAEGKSKVAHEEVFRWDERRADEQVNLYFLIQEGRPFGVNKRLPSLSIVVVTRGKVDAQKVKHESVLLNVPKTPEPGGGGHPGKGVMIPEGRQIIVINEHYGRGMGPPNTVDGLAEWTKGETKGEMRAALAVVVEWESFLKKK